MKKIFSWRELVKDCADFSMLTSMMDFQSFIVSMEVDWVNKCDGKTVEECEAMGYRIDDAWCIEVED